MWYLIWAIAITLIIKAVAKSMKKQESMNQNLDK